MRFLILLYPRAWRKRYADEILAMLRERDLSVSDAFDLVLGALDAHLNFCSGVDAVPVDVGSRTAGPAPPNLRLAALLLIAAGLLPLLTVTLHFPLITGAVVPSLDLISVLLSGTAVLGLWLRERQCAHVAAARGLSLSVLPASVCAAVAVFILTVILHQAVPIWVPLALLLLFNLGWSTLGIIEWRHGRLPSWVALPFTVIAVHGAFTGLLSLGFFSLHGGVGFTSSSWLLLANPLLAAGWVVLGLTLWGTSCDRHALMA